MIEVTQTRIERPELTGRLLDGLERGSVILVADAGFGKTTALEQALARRDGATVWLRAAPADGDPGWLVGRLVEAIREQLPGVAEDYAERLAAAIEPLDPEAIALSLVEDLERLLVEPLVLVIDDAERLEGSPAIAILNALLGGADELLRVAICSRRPLGLKLARLKASGRVSELGPADLAFTPAECSACIQSVRGREPTSREVEAIYEGTEGWPLGVALAAALGAETEQFPVQGREAIFEYFAEEVFDRLDLKLKRQLLDASVVDELDPQLEQALGLPDSFRSQVERAGIFVRSIGDSYSLHPLLRDFLRARLLGEREGAQLGELRRRVAAALASSGRTVEAIEQWLDGGDYESAANAIAAHGIPLAATSPETMTRWLDELPDELRNRPVLRLLAGRAAVGEGDFGAAVEHCRAGVAELEDEGAPEALLWVARLALTEAHIAALDLEAAAGASSGAEDAGPEAGPPAVFCELLHAAVQTRRGVEGSDRALEVALERPVARELLGGGLAAFRAQYRDLSGGHLDEALEHVNEAVTALAAHDPYGRLAYVLAFKMAIHEARGELERSLDTFDDLQVAAQRTGLAGFVGAGSRLSAATMLALLGRPEEARVQLERVDSDWSSWVGCDQHVTRALLAAHGGDRSTALAEAERALEEAKRMPAFDRVRPVTVLAPVICDTGEPDLAKMALEDLLAALGPADSHARARVALACLLHRTGEEAAANTALAEAFEDAGEQARFVLRTEWPQVEDVLWSALEAGELDAAAAVQALDAAFPGGPQVMSLAEHPVPNVRAAALAAAAAAGRPEALARLAEDDGGDADPDSRVRAVRERLERRPPPLRFRTLGGFELHRGSYAVDPGLWERKVAERVVRLLLIRGGELVSEDELLEAFWSGKSPDSARRSLQTAISSARSVLDLPWERSRLNVRDRSYSLALHDGDHLDAHAFEAAASRALAATGPERIATMEAAARLWTGAPLPEERYSDWAASWRERLSSLHADVLSALAEARSRAGDHAAAARAARALVDLDPLDEHAQRLLIGSYAAAGRRGDALRQFLECRRALVEELGIEPDAETLALQRRILAGA